MCFNRSKASSFDYTRKKLSFILEPEEISPIHIPNPVALTSGWVNPELVKWYKTDSSPQWELQEMWVTFIQFDFSGCWFPHPARFQMGPCKRSINYILESKEWAPRNLKCTGSTPRSTYHYVDKWLPFAWPCLHNTGATHTFHSSWLTMSQPNALLTARVVLIWLQILAIAVETWSNQISRTKVHFRCLRAAFFMPVSTTSALVWIIIEVFSLLLQAQPNILK